LVKRLTIKRGAISRTLTDDEAGRPQFDDDLRHTRRRGVGPVGWQRAARKPEFAADSALERGGFEPSVPREADDGFRTAGTSVDRGFRAGRHGGGMQCGTKVVGLTVIPEFQRDRCSRPATVTSGPCIGSRE
jgi:hypothetical protein